jgi:hypothetical protein
MLPAKTSRMELGSFGSRRDKRWHLRCALGILAAALVFEVGLRPFVADANYPAVAIRTNRNYTEGFSVAHYEADGLSPLGNRLTGNPPLPGAPEGLIVGDSHVQAQAVRDDETMGAVIERLSRTADRPLNVRQYGWPSGNAPTFLAAAESLLDRRNPAWVAVVLNAYNLSGPALPIGGRRPTSLGWRNTVRQLVARSTLAMALVHRFGLVRNQLEATAVEQRAGAARSSVIDLKKAYGARLLIVYTPSLLGAGHMLVEPAETEILRRCAEERVACISVRAALEQDRDDHFRLSRGFHNTAPGVGHFNAIGHRIIGEEIWRYLSSHSSVPLRTS